MPNFEAGHVLAQAAHYLGWNEIPNKYLQESHLWEILKPEEDIPLKNVSTNLTTTCDPVPGFSIAQETNSVI